VPAQDIDARAQAVVVLQLVDRPGGVSITQVLDAVDVEQERVTAAALSLAKAGVIRHEGDRLYATPALDRLDAIGLIAI
jgi:predicted transcriptional regulator